ncbi:MAG: nuclear transport factor 2 family protein [Gammaproteobacteria bacterium]|nr:nuclear transport factor 2 family protein [Gammaproteobacteria bacterium]
MQYQSSLDRNGLIDLALHRYFGSVDRKDMEATLDCFHDNALWTVQTSLTVHEGKAGIRRLFEEMFAAFEVIIHRDCIPTVDAANGRIAASFTAELHAPGGEITTLHNTNFWRVRGDRFQEVYVYMSGENPLS